MRILLTYILRPNDWVMERFAGLIKTFLRVAWNALACLVRLDVPQQLKSVGFLQEEKPENDSSSSTNNISRSSTTGWTRESARRRRRHLAPRNAVRRRRLATASKSKKGLRGERIRMSRIWGARQQSAKGDATRPLGTRSNQFWPEINRFWRWNSFAAL